MNAIIKRIHQDLESYCAKGNLDMVVKTLRYPGVSPEGDEGMGYPLRFACTYGHLDIAKTLLATGCLSPQNINKALGNACTNNQLEVAQYLVAFHQAQVPDDDTFISAARKHHLEVVSFLVQIMDLSTHSIKHYLTQEASPEVVDIVISKYESELLEISLKKVKKLRKKKSTHKV